jgi:hypothetical protein
MINELNAFADPYYICLSLKLRRNFKYAANATRREAAYVVKPLKSCCSTIVRKRIQKNARALFRRLFKWLDCMSYPREA